MNRPASALRSACAAPAAPSAACLPYRPPMPTPCARSRRSCIASAPIRPHVSTPEGTNRHGPPSALALCLSIFPYPRRRGARRLGRGAHVRLDRRVLTETSVTMVPPGSEMMASLRCPSGRCRAPQVRPRERAGRPRPHWPPRPPPGRRRAGRRLAARRRRGGGGRAGPAHCGAGQLRSALQLAEDGLPRCRHAGETRPVRT